MFKQEFSSLWYSGGWNVRPKGHLSAKIDGILNIIHKASSRSSFDDDVIACPDSST